MGCIRAPAYTSPTPATDAMGIVRVLMSRGIVIVCGPTMRLIRGAPEHLGYLLKDRVDDVEVVIDAMTRVTAGECVVDPTIVARLLHRSRERTALEALTPRELEVLAVMAEGRSNIAIDARLQLSPKTLEAHIRRILQRLGLEESPDDHRRLLAVLEYLHAPR
jgi:DNA-binding NarL/FixJ family response regulator